MSTTALIILDGFGCRKDTTHNAIALADTPNIDQLLLNNPNTTISASGHDVGLPFGQMGNSEVGHMNIGAGRIVYQNLTRISRAIEDKSFYENKILNKTIETANKNNTSIHIMGLVSTGGVHSHEDHIHALIDLTHQKNSEKVYVHAFIDGRDCPPRSAEPSIRKIEEKLRRFKIGRIASICGRFFAMDRDNRWDRIQPVYDMLTISKSTFTAASPEEGLFSAYQREESDEFVQPTIIVTDEETPISVSDGDVLIFINFRSDRARQLTRAFSDRNFKGFERTKHPKLSQFVTLTNYAKDIQVPCAFPTDPLHNTIGEYLAKQKKTQLRIAETEKYAHVTFFFSGGQEEKFIGEERILVPSPKVTTYDKQPEMSAFKVSEKLIEAIIKNNYDLIVCNFANCDMLGHTGVMNATIKAVETVDTCIGKIINALAESGGQCLITADHGNAEIMIDKSTGQPHTAHTNEEVPLIYFGSQNVSLKSNGYLCDIAPSLLSIMGLAIPTEMTGKSLIVTNLNN